MVPVGPDLVAPEVPGRGQPGPVLDGKATTVGQLFTLSGAATSGRADQHYVMRSDGLSPVSETGLALLLADPHTRAAYESRQVESLPLSSAALGDVSLSRDRSVNPLHPQAPPKPVEVSADKVPCVQIAMDGRAGPAARIALGKPPPAVDTPPVLATRDRRLADLVVVEPGAGLLIQDQPAPGVTDGALHLLVDTGVRYPLADTEVAEVLGYRGIAPTPVPAALLDLIPAGRLLDPAAARATLPAAQAPPTAEKEVLPSTSG